MTRDSRNARDYGMVEVVDLQALRGWLEAHHDSTPGAWVVTGKKTSDSYIAYDDIVREALRVGWIDSRPAPSMRIARLACSHRANPLVHGHASTRTTSRGSSGQVTCTRQVEPPCGVPAPTAVGRHWMPSRSSPNRRTWSPLSTPRLQRERTGISSPAQPGGPSSSGSHRPRRRPRAGSGSTKPPPRQRKADERTSGDSPKEGSPRRDHLRAAMALTRPRRHPSDRTGPTSHHRSSPKCGRQARPENVRTCRRSARPASASYRRL